MCAYGAAVQLEADGRRGGCVELREFPTGDGVHAGLRAESSCEKYLTPQSIGLGAAWPRPQIDASRITCDRSASSSRSQLGFSISADALAVPLRHGVHWPHDSCAKKRIVLRAALAAVSRSDN